MSEPSHGHIPVEHVVAADGSTIGIRRIPGSGNLIVALHGFTGDGSTMLPLLEACRAGRPAMAIDIIGHGASASPESLEHYEMSSVVDQVLSLIGPHDPGTVHLLGYSMGGRVALSIAARAPWYFGSIMTISSTPGIHDPVERAARYDADQQRAEHLEAVGVDAFIAEWLDFSLFDPYMGQLSDKDREETIAQRVASDVTGLANSLRCTGTGSMPPTWHMLPSVRSPLLAIAGELDTAYVDVAMRMAEAAPFGQSVIVPGAGHVTHHENCSAVAASITMFLEGCERDADL